MEGNDNNALRAWLQSSQVTVSELARRSGLTRQTLYNLMAGGAPTLATALAIETATGGAVPLRAWGADAKAQL